VNDYSQNQPASAPRWNPRDSRLLKINAAAERLQVSTKTMHTLIRRGEVRTMHLGTSVRVATRELDALIARIDGAAKVNHLGTYFATHQQEASSLD
jgi:excisionase family DNA binding protein